MNETQIRVAMMIDCFGGSFRGGGQTHLGYLKQKLEQNHNCAIFIFSQPHPSMLRRLFWNLWVIPQVLRAHRQKPYHLIHAQAYSAGISAKILSILLKIPVIYSVHGSNTLDMVARRFASKNWKYYFENFLLTQIKYDKEISVSANFLDYPNVNKNIVVIENGIDAGKVPNTKNQVPSAKNQLNNGTLNLELGTLLFVGRLEKVKGLDILLNSLGKLKDNKSFNLRIVGDGSLREQLENISNKLGLSDRVKFIGQKYSDDLTKEYQNADLFILPSITEGQPIVILDAWLHKLPVIVTSIGHNPWMIEDGKDGFMAKAGDEESLIKTIKRAISNRDKWKEMGEAGYKKVTSKYTWDITAKKTYEIYKHLIKK